MKPSRLSAIKKLLSSILFQVMHPRRCKCVKCQAYRVEHHIAIGGDR